ncbi:MAG: plasmid pRiA4b ORF-3 family protein [Chloroflexi bacterium]|jgi:hypothetical protein|nr:MAG: plasmid pRiA4b ORF-3 family protein [Chloroflexota bacterium]
MSPKPKIYQLKISLSGSKPPIWRRLLVKDSTSLADLHEIIQTSMGWENYHLHQFIINGEYYGVPHPDDWEDVQDEGKYPLKKLVPAEKYKFTYEYDFGDGWIHTVLVEKILPAEAGEKYPRCIKGKRACPPEDVGGIWGYGTFLEAIKDPKHEQHEMFINWIGYDFDPTYFDIAEINLLLSRYA